MTDINSIGGRAPASAVPGSKPAERRVPTEIAQSGSVEPVSRPAAAGPVETGSERSSAVEATELAAGTPPRTSAPRGDDTADPALNDAVAQLNDYAQSVRRELQFSIDNGTGRSVVRVVDRETQELIRQIPSDLALKLARQLDELKEPELFNARV